MNYRTLIINTAKYLAIFFCLNFVLAFLLEYVKNDTSFAEFFPTFTFGFIFIVMAVIVAIYRTKKEENE